MDRPALYLSPHVRACQVGGQVVLLDLHHSRYFGISQQHAEALAPLVANWPGPCAPKPLSSATVLGVDRPLMAQGLLTTTAASDDAPPKLCTPQRSLGALASHPDARPGFSRVQRMVRSAARASVSLRWRSLMSISASVQRRRQRTSLAGPDMQVYAQSIAPYEWFRPMVYTAREKCLLDSLSMLHYLSGERLDATWVLGVKVKPFGAHAWLQQGEIVLNDRHEYVRRFTPILVV